MRVAVQVALNALLTTAVSKLITDSDQKDRQRRCVFECIVELARSEEFCPDSLKKWSVAKVSCTWSGASSLSRVCCGRGEGATLRVNSGFGFARSLREFMGDPNSTEESPYVDTRVDVPRLPEFMKQFLAFVEGKHGALCPKRGPAQLNRGPTCESWLLWGLANQTPTRRECC